MPSTVQEDYAPAAAHGSPDARIRPNAGASGGSPDPSFSGENSSLRRRRASRLGSLRSSARNLAFAAPSLESEDAKQAADEARGFADYLSELDAKEQAQPPTAAEPSFVATRHTRKRIHQQVKLKVKPSLKTRLTFKVKNKLSRTGGWHNEVRYQKRLWVPAKDAHFERRYERHVIPSGKVTVTTNQWSEIH